jgi:hypothetical protein
MGPADGHSLAVTPLTALRETKSLGAAAQAVRRSAVPDAYAAHEKRAARVLDALSRTD